MYSMARFVRSAPFRDRRDGGRKLVESNELRAYTGRDDAVVLALPRGGVPVGYEVAQALDLPLDVFVVRKLGVPGHEELAMGAIASGGIQVLEEEVVRRLDLDEATIAAVAAREQRELEERERLYRDGSTVDLEGLSAILVDDGLATGSTMRAAVRALRSRDVEQAIVAVPVAPAESCRMLEREADAVVCALTPEAFGAVGLYYERFGQTTDEEVVELLGRSRRPSADS
jgi:putative phosphoribosyl transferase